MTWRDYHQATKHTEQSLQRSQYTLDWTNMPDPFRHYEGVPVLDLPADPPAPQAPLLDILAGAVGGALSTEGANFLSSLLYHSAAISATKRTSTGYQYALRVNPSSGNLHPTEFHFITRGLTGWPDGLYHYRPSSHMAEQRATGSFGLSTAPVVFVLTSIAWREAWKYHDRAYRYCLHDIGHAWQAISIAAQALGCQSFARGIFDDDEIANVCRLHDDEWPMLMVELTGGAIPSGKPSAAHKVWFGGHPNRLSAHQIVYPLIDGIHTLTKRNEQNAILPPDLGSGGMRLTAPISSHRPFAHVVRGRRSALDFVGGSAAMSLAQLSAILASTFGPLGADFTGPRFVQLYLYAHRIEGLNAGVYRYWPEHASLQLIRSGDQRVAAAGLSLGQDLAGNACVAFSMIADLDRATAAYGPRGYRFAHFEAAAIGQRLYLSAEAVGLAATGIGAFFDDKVHDYLNIAPGQGQVVYHFAVGYPVPDPRVCGV